MSFDVKQFLIAHLAGPAYFQKEAAMQNISDKTK